MMLPVDLDNVWIACRAAGVTQDAHYSFRMQRDIQRLGEVAGYAAALSVLHRCGARDIPFQALQEKLVATGALDISKSDTTFDFGPNIGSSDLGQLNTGHTITQEQVDRGLTDLRNGTPSVAIWYLYRAGDAAKNAVLAELESENPLSSWLAAGILAMWGDGRAEHRLLNAVRMQEYGFEKSDERQTPERNVKVVPNWVTAISLLRCCGTGASLPVLQDFAHQEGLALNVRTAIALTVERLIDRDVAGSKETDFVEKLLGALTEGNIPGVFEVPQRNIVLTLEDKGLHERLGPMDNTGLDYRWQLYLVLARICQKTGLPIPQETAQYRDDERALVRRAFRQISYRST